MCTVRIVLEGLPEHVQEIADALDEAIPDLLEWHDFASVIGAAEIVLTGSHSRQVAVSGDRAA